MTPIHFGFTMPADQLDKARRATFIQDLNRALELIAGHFDPAWIIDLHYRTLSGDGPYTGRG